MRKPAVSRLVVLSIAAAALVALPRVAAAQDGLAAAAAPRPNAAHGAAILRARDLPNTFGTTQTTYQRVGVADFVPADSSMTYSDLAISSSTWSRYPTNANGDGAFVAAPKLPSGALLDAVEFDFCDVDPGLNLTGSVEVTSYTGEGTTAPASGSSTDAAGCGSFVVDLSASPIEIDNAAMQLLLVVNIPTQSGTVSISGAILRYHLQVSPAPASPTFADVPASDFGFQYVEALSASGITGGCGGGNFCPDNPVTRRQMAIFLAKALGLQFQ
jgi:hypothetical protein